MIEEFRGHPLSTFYNLPVFTFGFGDADDLVPGDTPPASCRGPKYWKAVHVSPKTNSSTPNA